MKKLPEPTINDSAVLDLISAEPLMHLSLHAAHVPNLKAQYTAYIAASGNAAATNAPPTMTGVGDLKDLLDGYYERRRAIGHLKDVVALEDGSPLCCPMCGATHPTTLDHVFPRKPYGELSIFSRNLVPACAECNRVRKNDYKGTQPGQRILHPYFDAALQQPLVEAALSPVAGRWETPTISLRVCIPTTDPLHPAVDYHVTTVLLRTRILRHLRALWSKLGRNPSGYLNRPTGPTTAAEVSNALDDRIAYFDGHMETPNNWESMFYRGVRSNSPARNFLLYRAEGVRAGTLRPDTF